MIPYVPSSYQTAVMGLLGVWALAYIAGLIFGKTNADRTRRTPIWAKLIMIGVVLVIGGMGWLVFARGTGAEPYARWLFFGLLAGAVGDLLLAEVFPVKESLLVSMGVFAVGHIFYLMAIFALRNILVTNSFVDIAIIVVPSIFAAAILWEFVVHNSDRGRTLNRASFFYGLLLVVTTAFAAYFAISKQVMMLLAIGMALFMISDGLLAQVTMKQRGFPYIHDIVWILYSAGQLLIALSIAEAAQMLG